MRNVIPRHCAFIKPNGEPCRMAPLQDGRYCWAHDPQHVNEATEARRLGGQRRRKEGTLQAAYEFEGLASVQSIRRLLEIAAVDALALENSIARVRAITGITTAAAKLLEVGELEDRVAQLEQAVKHQPAAVPAFDVEG